MKVALIAVCLFWIAACQLTTAQTLGALQKNSRVLLQSIHSDLLGNFTHEEQPTETDVYVHHSGRIPFTGDCDDFHAAARYRLVDAGYVPVAVTGFKASGKFHVFTCTDKRNAICLDPNFDHVQSLNTLRGVYRNITVYPL